MVSVRQNPALVFQLLALLLGQSSALQFRSLSQDILAEPPPGIDDVGFEAVKTWTERRLEAGEASFKASGHERMQSPSDWSDSIVYHIQMDRFNNGNTSNDLANPPYFQTRHLHAGNLTMLPIWKHGGDMQGVRDRLGYIEALGFDTLWPTPLLMNDGAYHGYCATDPTNTDPNFGSPEELRELVADAHSKGIRFVLDIVVNHLCDGRTSYIDGSWDHDLCISNMNKSHWEGGDTSAIAGQGELNFSKHFFPPFRSQKFFNRCGLLPDAEMRCMSCPGTVFGDFSKGMYDYNTRDVEFQELFTNMMKFWIAFADVDGVRLDAAKHVTEDFVAYFSTEMRLYADSLGKENFFVIGEVAAEKDWKAIRLGKMMSTEGSSHGQHVPSTLTKRLADIQGDALAHRSFPFPGLNAVYNFEKSGRAGMWIRASNTSRDLADFYRSDEFALLTDQLPQTNADPFTSDQNLWNALELHDWGRFLEYKPVRSDLSLLGIFWLFTTTGTPVIYAGQEQGFNGNCPENFTTADPAQRIEKICARSAGIADTALGRQDMFASGPWRLGSAIPSVNALAYIGMPPYMTSRPPHYKSSYRQVAWEEDPMIPTDHFLWKGTRQLVKLRKSCEILRHGSLKVRYSEQQRAGWVAYSRIHKGVEAVALINPNDDMPAKPGKVRVDADQNILESGFGKRFINIFNPEEEAWVERGVDDGAFLNLGDTVLPVASAALYMPEDHLTAFNSDLQVSLCKN